MKVDPMHARETGPPIGESADGLLGAEPTCEKAEGSELGSLAMGHWDAATTMIYTRVMKKPVIAC
jgi:hypothetical protein